MLRQIIGFHQDDAGDWVAELSCLHGQHVRHRPPFQQRSWAVTEAGRAGRIGADIECPLCDRAELPGGLAVVRVAGPFDEATMPAGLRRAHRVHTGTWACIRVLEGTLRISMQTEPPIERHIAAGGGQAIPPEVEHEVSLSGPVRFEVDFLAVQRE